MSSCISTVGCPKCGAPIGFYCYRWPPAWGRKLLFFGHPALHRSRQRVYERLAGKDWADATDLPR